MKNNVITYGTFDVLHKGHKNVIKKAFDIAGENGKVMVGVSSDRWNNLKGKKSYDNQEKRCNSILKEFPNAIVFLEDHNEHMEQWFDDYDKYEIDFILMGSDHIDNLSILDNKITSSGRKVNILFTKRTPGISSTMIREKIKSNKS